MELFNWLYAIEDNHNPTWDEALLVWHVKYQHIDQAMMDTDIDNNNVTKSSRLRHRLEIKKDDVQMVVPISKVIVTDIHYTETDDITIIHYSY